MRSSIEHIALYKAIDEIMWNDWDPIGMKYIGGPRDEYQGYLPAIFSLKISGASIEAIASKLFDIETNRMGYENGYERCIFVAKKIAALTPAANL